MKCPDCGSDMILRETKKFLTKGGMPRKFFGCSRWPACKATHGADPQGNPLGHPADTETKEARVRLHKLCGVIWGDWETATPTAKRDMYRWLRENAPKEHIGDMTLNEIEKTEALMRIHGLI